MAWRGEITVTRHNEDVDAVHIHEHNKAGPEQWHVGAVGKGTQRGRSPAGGARTTRKKGDASATVEQTRAGARPGE
jgi:hypothetical protein